VTPAALRIDPGFKRYLIRYFSIGAVFYVLASVVQTTFYQWDQHFKVLEFAHFKTRPTNVQLLPWEYPEQVQSWTQPGLYAVTITALKAIGIDNPFTHDRVLRLGSAVLALIAIVLFCIALADWLPLDGQRRWLAIIFGLFWLLPSHHTRTSSENLASIFLLFGLSALFLLRRNRAPVSPSQAALGPFTGAMTFSYSGLVMSGLLLGLSFTFRYQMGIVIAAIGVWLLMIPRIPFRQFVVFGAGVMLSIGVGLLIDWWGYGAFQITPWNYFRIQVLEGRAATFRTDPWYYYFLQLLIQPVGIVLLISGFLFWITRPRNLLTWATALFVLAHVLMTNKEMRFLTPITHLGLAMFVFMIPRRWFLLGDCNNPFLGHGRWVRRAFYVFATINLVVLVGASIRGPRIEVAIHKAIYRSNPDHFEFYSLGPTPFIFNTGLRMEFYSPRTITHHVLSTMTDLDTVLADTPEVIWYHEGNTVDDAPAWPAFHDHCSLLYQSYGPWMRKINFFDWQRRKHTTSLYRCRRDPL